MYYPIRKLERWPCLHETRCLVGCTVFPVTVPPPFPQPVLPGQGRERGDPDGPQSFPESFHTPHCAVKGRRSSATSSVPYFYRLRLEGSMHLSNPMFEASGILHCVLLMKGWTHISAPPCKCPSQCSQVKLLTVPFGQFVPFPVSPGIV